VRHTKILAAPLDHTNALFSDIPKLREEDWFSRGKIAEYIMIDWKQAVGSLKDKEEGNAMAALNRFDVGRLNKVLDVFARFAKYLEGNSVSCFDIFSMLQTLIANQGSLHTNKHAETLTKAVSGHFSRATDSHMMFACFRMIPAGKWCYGDVPRPGALAASMDVVWNRVTAALTTAFPTTLPR
jgi:hypothetical protein